MLNAFLQAWILYTSLRLLRWPIRVKQITVSENTFQFQKTHFNFRKHISISENTFQFLKTHFNFWKHISISENIFQFLKTHYSFFSQFSLTVFHTGLTIKAYLDSMMAENRNDNGRSLSYCTNCGTAIAEMCNFCTGCGSAVGVQVMEEPSSLQNAPGNVDRRQEEEEMIRLYFNCGYKYEQIVALLGKYHGIEMSMSTLTGRSTFQNHVTMRIMWLCQKPVCFFRHIEMCFQKP